MSSTTQDIETGIIRGPKRNFLYAIFSAVFLEAFILTFLAEWGDRSQIATIILAAREVSIKLEIRLFLPLKHQSKQKSSAVMNKHRQWRNQNAEKVWHIKGRQLKQAVFVFNCVPFQNWNFS